MFLQVDYRSRTFEIDEALVARVTQEAEAAQDALVTLAKLLLELSRKQAYYAHGCSSIVMFGGRLGFEASEVRRLIQLARSIESTRTTTDAPAEGDSGEGDLGSGPVDAKSEDAKSEVSGSDDAGFRGTGSFVEDRIRAKALTIPAAIALAPVLTEPELFAEKNGWLDAAQRDSYWEFRRNARQRVAEIRCGEPVERIELTVPDSVVERFDRAQVLASRKAGRQLSRDETFETVVDAYVDANDPLAVAEGKRRVVSTKELPDKRYIPKSVERAVRRRAGDKCEFPGCYERVHLQFAHRRPHFLGGCREAHNLLLLCRDHHFFHDARFLVAFGPTANPLWIEHGEIVYTREDPAGHVPYSDREVRAVRAWQRMWRARNQPADGGGDGESEGKSGSDAGPEGDGDVEIDSDARLGVKRGSGVDRGPGVDSGRDFDAGREFCSVRGVDGGWSSGSAAGADAGLDAEARPGLSAS